VDLKEENILGDQVSSHWYYRAKAAALLTDLRGQRPNEIMDIGAGSGFFSKTLLKATGAQRAVCVDTGYVDEWDEHCCGKPISFRRAISSTNADLVLAMDVIEHVSDDAGLLRSYRDLVRPGTRFILSVPAFNFLWSRHDVFLGHYRRYTLDSLQSAMQRSGLKVDWSHYYYATVFPIAGGMRLLERLKKTSTDIPKSQLRRHGVFINESFSTMLAAERLVMRANRLFGITAFAGGHKP
jgi:2-polyprenyl-3-methyl-5-hydroxy-6-metoxy-1,4-benzoquinol methylase